MKKQPTIQELEQANLTLNQQCFNIYNVYPRHICRGRAIPAIETALRKISKEFPTIDAYTFLLAKVKEFALSDLGQSKMAPYCENFMIAEQYVDDTEEWNYTE